MRGDVLGVDIGGVIISRTNDKTDTSFFADNYLSTKSTHGAFEALKRLVEGRFGENVHLISKCGPDIQVKTWRWLEQHEFFDATGISPYNVHFCLKKSEKAGICKRLGVTHFIDDRLEVLIHLQAVPNRYLFQPSADEVARFAESLGLVTVVNDWDEVLLELLLKPAVVS